MAKAGETIPNLPELTLRIISGSSDNVLHVMRLPGTIIPTSNVLYEKYQVGLEMGEVTSLSDFVHEVDWEHTPSPILGNMFVEAEHLLLMYHEKYNLQVQGFRGPTAVRDYRENWFDRPIASHHVLALWGRGRGSTYLKDIPELPMPLAITRTDKMRFERGWEWLSVPVLFQVAFILDMPHLMNAIKKLIFFTRSVSFEGMFTGRGVAFHQLIECEVCGLRPVTGTCPTCRRGRYCSKECRDAGHDVCSVSALCISPRLVERDVPLMNRHGFLHGFGKDALTELYAGVSAIKWTNEEHLDTGLVGLMAWHCTRAHAAKGSPPATFFDESIASNTMTMLFHRTLAVVGTRTSFALDHIVTTRLNQVTRKSIELNPSIAVDIVKFRRLDILTRLLQTIDWPRILHRPEVYRAAIEENWIDGIKVLFSGKRDTLDITRDDFALVRLARNLKHDEIVELMRLQNPAVADFLKR